MTVDYYAVLGVPPHATQQELRTAYLGLARTNHPDLFTGPAQRTAETKMQSINEAWSVLGVAHERTAYDSKREHQGEGPAAGTTQAKGPRRGRTHFAAFDDEPISRLDVDLDPTPIRGSKPLPDWLRMAPVLFVVLAVPFFLFGMAVGASGIVALAMMMFVVGVVGFLLLPLLVMTRAAKDDKR